MCICCAKVSFLFKKLYFVNFFGKGLLYYKPTEPISFYEVTEMEDDSSDYSDAVSEVGSMIFLNEDDISENSDSEAERNALHIEGIYVNSDGLEINTSDISSGEMSPIEPVVDENVSLEQDVSSILPSEHLYLGNLNTVRGRIFFDHNSVIRLPLLFPSSPIMLVPGQTFPFIEGDIDAINVLRHCIDTTHSFGIVSQEFWLPGRPLAGVVGTIADIYEWDVTPDNFFKIKAKGRQRFKMLRVETEDIGYGRITFADAKVLPEIVLPPFVGGSHLQSLNKYKSPSRYKCMKYEASQLQWPSWVYRNYDETYLVNEMKNKVTKHAINFKLMDEASSLSFQLLKVIPMSVKVCMRAMQLNSPLQRLRLEISVLDSQETELVCSGCLRIIGCQSDIFSMSVEGPQGTYVNPHGFIHEIITLRKAQNVVVVGSSSTEYSWFPGYSWTILSCKGCYFHIGWRFSSVEENGSPKDFWGIKYSSVIVKRNVYNDDHDDDHFIF